MAFFPILCKAFGGFERPADLETRPRCLHQEWQDQLQNFEFLTSAGKMIFLPPNKFSSSRFINESFDTLLHPIITINSPLNRFKTQFCWLNHQFYTPIQGHINHIQSYCRMNMCVYIYIYTYNINKKQIDK